MHDESKFERLRREVRKGLDQIERGEVVDGRTFFAKWEKDRNNRLK